LIKLLTATLLLLVFFASSAEARRSQHQPSHWQWHSSHLRYHQPPHWYAPKRIHYKERHFHFKKKKKQRTYQLARKKKNTSAAALVTVPTAAGIKITVSKTFAPKITAFIADLAERGYKPKSIHCHARGGHVHGSRHYSGNACDFDQTGWGKTAKPMYKVADLAKKHGLRDGGSFRDWGHIDDGKPLSRYASKRGRTRWAASGIPNID